MFDPESDYQGRPEFLIKMNTYCMKALRTDTRFHLRFQIDIVISKTKKAGSFDPAFRFDNKIVQSMRNKEQYHSCYTNFQTLVNR